MKGVKVYMYYRPAGQADFIPVLMKRRGPEKIAKQHENYHRGLLHFLATDKRVPEKVRADMQRFGLPRDEFSDTP